jgi:hypothetical protein
METKSNENIAVVVAVTDDVQFNEFIMASPGLQELDVDIISVHGAKSAAEAFYLGIEETTCPWIIYCHQDVYFPEGSGREIERLVSTLSKDTVLGFAGLSGRINSDEIECVGIVYSGKLGLLDFRGRRTDAVSLDELAIVLNRDCKYQIDPKLGWHLWGTDLCLQAALDGCPARVERVLMTHNSSHDYIGNGGLPAEFEDSKKVLIAKYPQLNVFYSLCTSWHRELRRALRQVSSRRPPRSGR